MDMMNSNAKVDILDLIISILREQEEKVDNLMTRLENLLHDFSQQPSPQKFTPEVEAELCDLEQELRSTGMSILLVDDDEDLVHILRAVLRDAGYSVETAATGMQALNKVKRTRFNLVILDIMLPDILGDEVAKKLRRVDNKMSIILITGYPAFLDRINKQDLGIDDVLLKPIDNDELVSAANNAISRAP